MNSDPNNRAIGVMPYRCAMRMTQMGAPMRNATAMRTSQSRSSQRGMVKTLIVARRTDA